MVMNYLEPRASTAREERVSDGKSENTREGFVRNPTALKILE